MKKFVAIVLIISGMSVFIPRAEAEPVTMVVLAPLALEAAKQASPYVITAMRNGGMQLLEVGKDLGNILRLPLGIIQATIGAPFGLYGSGWENILRGIAAPVQLVGDVLILPLSFFGVGVP
ncbi:MAG: hypothetical protein IKC82_03085 [Lentisphaeria bacterium]|nr:hypothetical protein [Lentisphaeria bacterium]